MGWQLVVAYGMTLLTLYATMVWQDAPPITAEVILPIQPAQYVYVTPPELPDRNPMRGQ